MTPRELALRAEVYGEAQEAARKDAISTAYLTAALSRAEKMPRLEKLLEKTETKPKAQSPEEMLAIAMRLNAGNKGGIVRGEG